MVKPELQIVHANIILYALAHWMCVPVIPYLSKELGADPVMFGYLQTAAGLAQLLGGPLLGWLVDVRGARYAMIISQLAGGLSYFCLATAWTVPMLFLSKVPTIFQHALQAAQMCVTLMSDEESRPKMIARLSLYYGVGFVVGPFVGGWLSTTLGESGQQKVAFIASLISFACVWLDWYYLPPLSAKDMTASKDEPAKPVESQGPPPAEPKDRKFMDMFAMLWKDGLRNLLLFSFLVGVALSSFYTALSLAAEPQFGMNEQGLGSIMSYLGGLSMVNNAFVIPAINAYLLPSTAMYGALAILAASLATLSLADTLWKLYLVLTPFVLAMAIFRAYSVSMISASVPTDEAGSAIGLAHAAQSLSSVVAPAITGHIYRNFGFTPLCLTQGIIVVLGGIALHMKSAVA